MDYSPTIYHKCDKLLFISSGVNFVFDISNYKFIPYKKMTVDPLVAFYIVAALFMIGGVIIAYPSIKNKEKK